MDPTDYEIVLKDEIDPPLRSLKFDIKPDAFIDCILDTDLVHSHTGYTVNTSILLCGEDERTGKGFLTNIEVYPGEYPETKKSFDDYFTPVDGSEDDDDNTNDNTRQVTTVLFDGYVRRPDLSAETGRDYIGEKEACVRALVQLVDDEFEPQGPN